MLVADISKRSGLPLPELDVGTVLQNLMQQGNKQASTA